jgi:hypothetical protein
LERLGCKDTLHPEDDTEWGIFLAGGGKMTIREEINAKKRSVMRIALLGFSVFAAGCGLSLIVPGSGVLGIPGFAVFFLTMAYAHAFAFRCPSCSTNWNDVVLQSGGSLFAIADRIKFCPYCKVDLDSKAVSSKAPSESGLNGE